MVIKNSLQNDFSGVRYPFTSTSTMRLTDDRVLPEGLISSCLIHPCVADASTQCACVRKLYRQEDYGCLDIYADTGSFICTVKFAITPREFSEASMSKIIGKATDARGLQCGHMAADPQLLLLCSEGFSLDPDSLILLPSCCRFLPVSADFSSRTAVQSPPNLTHQGTIINRIVGDGKSTYVDSWGGVRISKTSNQSPAETEQTFKSVYVNGVCAGNATGGVKNINIGTTYGGLRVRSEGDVITIGRLCDL